MRSVVLFLCALLLLLTGCQTQPITHVIIVPYEADGAATAALINAHMRVSDCRHTARCQFTLKVENRSDKAVSLLLQNLHATSNGHAVSVITPQQLLAEFQSETSDSLTAQQFSSPPPRSINDTSLSQRQLAESGRTAAVRLEEQLARMRYLKKITTQMLDKTSIGPAASYTGLVVLDLSGVEAGQIIRVRLSVAATTLDFSFSARSTTAK